jgi:DNA-binding transcriptional LysR family regulator
VLVGNDPTGLLVSVLSGVGVALLPDSFGGAAVSTGRLRRILAAWSGPSVDLNAVYPPGRMHAPKVRAFVDFLTERINLNAAACRVLCVTG